MLCYTIDSFLCFCLCSVLGFDFVYFWICETFTWFRSQNHYKKLEILFPSFSPWPCFHSIYGKLFSLNSGLCFLCLFACFYKNKPMQMQKTICLMSCFFLLNIISWGISLLVQKGSPHSFFCDITKEYSIVWRYHSLFNRSLTDEHFCCFLSFAATEVIQCITLHLYCLIFGEM